MCAKSRPVPNSLLPATASRLRDYAGGGRRVLTPQQEAALARTRCRMEQGWPIGRMPQRKQSTGSNFFPCAAASDDAVGTALADAAAGRASY
jgi:hypothetical protein